MTIIGIKSSKKRRVVLPLMSKVKLEVPMRSRFQISKTDVTVTKKKIKNKKSNASWDNLTKSE